MRPSSVSSGLLAVALTTLAISPASAQEYHRHYHYGLVGGVFGLAGAVVVGAVTIATAPIVILGDALSGGRNRYYHRDGYYDRRGPAYNDEGSGGSDYRYPPRRAYDYPPQGYAPDQGFERGPSQSYPPDEAYNAPRRGYYPEPADPYSRPQGYRSPRYDYRDRPDAESTPSDGRYGPPDQNGSGPDYGPPPRSYPPDDDPSDGE